MSRKAQVIIDSILIEKLEDLTEFQGEVLDAYDELPNDIKNEIDETPLGQILSKRLSDLEG